MMCGAGCVCWQWRERVSGDQRVALHVGTRIPGSHAYSSDLCTGISERALSEFIEEAMSAECSKDARRLKRCVKAFCGGKKKANK